MNLATRLLAAIALAGVLFTPTASAQFDSDEVISLKFAGGTAVDYINAVRKAGGDVNIVVDAGVENVRMPAVELKQATIEAALQLLDQVEYRVGEQRVILDLDMVSGTTASSRAVYKVQVVTRSTQGPRVERSQVWSLAEILKDGGRPADVLAAIEAGLGLFDEQFGRAQIRFHEETKLLIVRAHPEQIETIESVVYQLQDALPGRTSAAELKQFKALADEQRAMVETKLAKTRNELDGTLKELTIWRTRAELYQGEIAALRAQLDETRFDLQNRIMEQQVMIEEMNARIVDLKRQLSADKNG